MIRWTKRKDSWRIKEEYVLMHVMIVATSLTWARSKEKSQQTQRKEKERRRERGKQTRQGERKKRLCLQLRLESQGEDCWENKMLRNEDEEEGFCQHGFLPLCGGALRYSARTMPFLPHFFQIYLSLPIGWVYQSLAANVGDEALVLPSLLPSFVFSWWIRGPSIISSTMIAEYLMDNSVLVEYFNIDL